MSETNEMISVIRSDEKRRLMFLLQHKIAVDYPKELSPEENKRRILRDIYRKKVDRYGFKTKYFNSIVFNSNIYSLIYPFAGEFALTFSNGQFLPFNERRGFDIHKVYRLDITNSDELKNYDFELSDIHAENLEDYIDGSENPQNSVHYILQKTMLYNFLNNTLHHMDVIFDCLQFIPSQFQERLFHMSKEDRKAINEIIAHHDEYKDIGDALKALKEKRPNLYELSMEMKDYIDNKINELTPEAKKYVLKRIDVFREVRPTIEHKHEYLEVLQAIHDTIQEYNQLSEESRLNIAMTFPKEITYITSEKFKKLIDGLMEDFEETSS